MTKDKISEIRRNLHLLRDGENAAIFHGVSYRFFQVGERIADALQRIEETPLDGDFSDIKEEIGLLHKLSDQADKVSSDLEAIRMKSKCFYLFVSQECNLKCLYCYGDGGSYKKATMMMDEETLKNFFDKCVMDKQTVYDIVFFGGEPLMNFPLVRKAVELGNQKRKSGFEINYTLVTNGTVFNPEIRQFISDHIGNVTVSLDGPKGYNDLQRPSIGGFSSHDSTIRTIKEIRDEGISLSIRTIVTKKNYANIGDVYRHNLELNPDGVGITPVDVPPTDPVYLTGEEYRRLADDISRISCENLSALAEGDEPAYYEFSYALLERVYTGRKRFYACGAGRAQFGVAADGEVYPCHRFVGMKDFCIGNINSGDIPGIDFQKAEAVFNPLSVHTIEDCNGCWARYLCGGCCYLQSLQYKGDTAKPLSRYCYFKKKVYHDLLLAFQKIMVSPDKRERLHRNLKLALEKRKDHQDRYINPII